MSFCAASPEEWRDFDMEGGRKIAAKLPKLVTKRTAPIVTKKSEAKHHQKRFGSILSECGPATGHLKSMPSIHEDRRSLQ